MGSWRGVAGVKHLKCRRYIVRNVVTPPDAGLILAGPGVGLRRLPRLLNRGSGAGICEKIKLPQNPVRQTKGLARRKAKRGRKAINSQLPVPDRPNSGSGSCEKIKLSQNPVRQTKDLARRKEVERQLIHSFLSPIARIRALTPIAPIARPRLPRSCFHSTRPELRPMTALRYK